MTAKPITIPAPPEMPVFCDLHGKVFKNSIEIKVESYKREGNDFPKYDNGNLKYIFKIRLKQKLGGKFEDNPWKILKDDERDYLKIPTRGYKDGIYEISAVSYIEVPSDNGEKVRVSSKEEVIIVTIIKGKEEHITPLNTCEFDRYKEQVPYMNSPGNTVTEYVDSIVARDFDIKLNGLLVEIGLFHENPEIIHKMEAKLIVNDQEKDTWHDIIFETDENQYQYPGNKAGVVFIPYDYAIGDDIKIKLHTMEFGDLEMKMLLDEYESIKSIKDFVWTTYLTLGREKPQILFDLDDSKSLKDVSIIFNNCNFMYYDMMYQVLKNDERIVPSKWKIAHKRIENISLTEPGKYEIHAIVSTKAENPDNDGLYHRHVLLEEVRTFTVEDLHSIDFTYPKIVQKDSEMTIEVSIKSPFEPYTLNGSLRKYETIAEITSLEKENGVYKYNATIKVPENIPTGLQVFELIVEFQDGEKQKKSFSFFTTDEKNIQIDFYN